MINIIFSFCLYGAIGWVFYILLKRKAFFSLSVLSLYFLFQLFVFISAILSESIFWAIFITATSFFLWSWLFLVFFVPALFFDFWRARKIRMQNIGTQDNKSKNKIALAVLIFVALVVGFIFVKYPELYRGENRGNNEIDLTEDFSDSSISFKINPKDYSLVGYPLEQSPIYSRLPEYCFNPEDKSSTVQQDTRIVKNNNEVVVPSMRQLIFASENKEPNCITIVGIFSAPVDGKYLYLKVSELSFKEHLDWPIYRLDLSDLSIKKSSYVSTGGSIRTEEGFIVNKNELLFDGKKVIRWDDREVYMVNLETDSKTTLYSTPQNQWLVSNINPTDVIGKFLDTDVKIKGNNILIGVYDKNKTFAKNSPGYHDYDVNYEFVNRTTIPILDNNKTDLTKDFGEVGIIVISPKPDQMVSSPLKITGYIYDFGDGWEADFGSVELVDGNGKRIAIAGLGVDSTDDEGTYKEPPYGFEATLVFNTPKTKKGVLKFDQHCAKGADCGPGFDVSINFDK